MLVDHARRKHARKRGAPVVHLDLDQLGEPGRPQVDVPDIDKAVSEIARVLKPGGRAAAAVWAGPEVNAWATIAGAAMGL